MTAATIVPVAGKEDYSMEAIQITSIEVVILVHTSGVNFIDVYFRDNYYKAPLPLIPGAEGSGYIAAQAEGVSGFEVGGVTVHYTLISTNYVRTREQMTAIMDAVCGQDLGVLIRPACAPEVAVSAQRNLESRKATGTRALGRGAGMEIKRTRTRTRNEPRQFKTVPLRMGPTSCSLENPTIRVPRTDNDLVQAAQSRDHEDFAALCRRHAQVATQKILPIVRHREYAEDASVPLFRH
jgi:hypothetical protein